MTFFGFPDGCEWVNVVVVVVVVVVVPKINWLHLTGEVDKSVTFHVKFSQDFICQKSLKRVNF